MVGWHNQLNGHDFEQAPGDSEGQGRLACCSPWSAIEQQPVTHERIKSLSSLLIFLPVPPLRLMGSRSVFIPLYQNYGSGLITKSCAIPWTVACQAPLSWILQARILK